MEENKKTEKKAGVKKLDPVDVMKEFIKAVKAMKSTGIKDKVIWDVKGVLKYCQLTWVKTSKTPEVPLLGLRTDAFVGNTSVRVKKHISVDCIILEVKSARGTFSSKVICESEPYKTDYKGTWGVNPLSFRKM